MRSYYPIRHSGPGIQYGAGFEAESRNPYLESRSDT